MAQDVPARPARPLPFSRELTPEEHAAIWEPHKTAMRPRPKAARPRPAASQATEPAQGKPQLAGSGSELQPATVAARWHQAVSRHQAIADAYGALLLDPLAALTHAALWDITNPRCAAFILAYAEISDILALHPTLPDDPALVTEYATKVRHTHAVWLDALHHAEQLGYTWLEAAEAAKARRAERLLRQAQDTRASDAERSLAAHKARGLLDAIRGVRLPTEVYAAVESSARRSLPGSDP